MKVSKEEKAQAFKTLLKESKVLEQGIPDVDKVKTYSEIPINEEMLLQIGKLAYEGVETTSLNPYIISKKYKIYKSKFGEGNATIYVVTKPSDHLSFGEEGLRLKKIDYKTFIEKYCEGKEFLAPNPKTLFGDRFKVGKDEEELTLKQIFEKQETLPFFFEKIKPTTINNVIKAVEEIGFSKMLKDYHCENGKIDTTLEYIFRINRLNFGNECSSYLAKYNPHSLVVTNTKTGKSTQLEKQTPLKYDSGTSRRLLGYSTGDKSYEGDLHNKYQLVVLDDFTGVNYENEILDNLPSILENGKARIGKGKKTITTLCSSTFTLTTNSKRELGGNELVLEFIKILNRLSGTLQRIGSRFGLIVFGNEFKKAQFDKYVLSKKEIKVNGYLIEQIFEDINNFILELLDNRKIEKFLEDKNENYEKLMNSILLQRKLIGELREFWESTIDANRHQKGFALKQGVIDYFIDNNDKLILLLKNELVLEDEDIDKIVKFSKENLNFLNDINLKSLRKIISISDSEREYLTIRYEGLSGYEKALVSAVMKLLRSKPQTEENLLPLISVGAFLDKEGRYYAVSRIKEKLPNRLERVSRNLETFGIELVKIDHDIFIQINQTSKKVSRGWDFGENGENGEK